jgi:hypothetical protein
MAVAITAAPASTRSAAVATITTSATASAEALARRTFLARTSFIDREGTALKVFLVERGNGFFGVSRRSHFDERKAAGTAGGSILHDADRNNAASLGKKVLEIVFGRGVSEVAHKQLSCHTGNGVGARLAAPGDRPRLRFQLSPLQTSTNLTISESHRRYALGLLDRTIRENPDKEINQGF